MWLGFEKIVAVLLLIFGLHGIAYSQRPDTDPRINSWAETKAARTGKIRIYWYESKPFIFANERGQMAGIEVDLLAGFKIFLKKEYAVDLIIEYQPVDDFGEVLSMIRDKSPSGAFGASAYSISPGREQQVSFTPPYMSDITVIISTKDVPIVKTEEEFKQTFTNLNAITNRATTYEDDLHHMKEDGGLHFPITYIPANENIVSSLEKKKRAFAIVDLPIYLMMFNKNPSLNVNRQNLFQKRRKGYAILYPKGSDWAKPMKEYFDYPDFQTRLEKSVTKYISLDLYKVVETMARESNDPVILLSKEKEIQQKELLLKTEKIAQESRWRNFLVVLVIVVFSFLLVIITLYKKRHEQKEQIEEQQKNLTLKSGQLEERNQYLIELDQEKNKLVMILAHDLRTPINHVQGLATVFLLSNKDLPEDQSDIIRKISDSAIRLNKMISSILDIDALENNRVHVYPEDVLITSVLQQVVKSFEKQAQKKDIVLHLASVNEELLIRADSLFLIQVLENLISNAIKFSGNNTSIDISVEEQSDKVNIRIKDHGPGLTEEDQQLLFKKFQRLSALPTGGEGCIGLGLSIVKKYVELMGGRVWGESVPGQGATFVLEFNKA